MFMLVKHQHHGIKSVLGEELRAADDHNDEANGIEHKGDELLHRAIAKVAESKRHAEAGQPHADAAGQSGEHEGRAAAGQLLASILHHLLKNLVGAAPFAVLLHKVQYEMRTGHPLLPLGTFSPSNSNGRLELC